MRSIDRDLLAILDEASGSARPHDTRYPILARDHRRVRELAARIGHYRLHDGEQRCPGGRRRLTHEDIARLEFVSILQATHDFRRTGRLARGRCTPGQHGWTVRAICRETEEAG